MMICYVCQKEKPDELKEDHHVRPKAYGGEMGEQKPLCNFCHDTTHKIADMIYYGKVSSVRDVLVSVFEKRDQMERLLDLAKTIVEGRLLKEEGKIDREIEPVVCFVGSEIKQGLKLIAVETKRPLKSVVSALLTDFVYKRYPKLRNDSRRKPY